jgi:hypothetical protein
MSKWAKKYSRPVKEVTWKKKKTSRGFKNVQVTVNKPAHTLRDNGGTREAESAPVALSPTKHNYIDQYEREDILVELDDYECLNRQSLVRLIIFFMASMGSLNI